MSNWREMLKEAKELFDDGLISETEYDQMRKEALALRSQSTNPGTTTPPMPTSSVLQDIGTVVGEPSTVELSAPEGLDNLRTIRAEAQVHDVIGNYTLLLKIGQGGMGTVFKARHNVERYAKVTGDVVIKLMNPELSTDPEFIDRFIDEAALGKTIKHPNFVDIHDVVVDADTQTLAIVMSFIEGRSLNKLIPPNGMPMSKVVPIVEQLASAIDHIHTMGLIHRDLKPENILIQPDGTPVILDLGIAKSVTGSDVSKTKSGVTMGTMLYMPPEQLNAKNATSAADRYALGLIVYEMLMGRLPWEDGLEGGDILVRKFTGDLVPITNQPEYVVDSVMRLLRVKVTDRWDSCADFLNVFVESEEDRAKRLAAERAEQERIERERKAAEEKARKLAEEKKRQEELEAEQERKAREEAERKRKEEEEQRRLTKEGEALYRDIEKLLKKAAYEVKQESAFKTLSTTCKKLRQPAGRQTLQTWVKKLTKTKSDLPKQLSDIAKARKERLEAERKAKEAEEKRKREEKEREEAKRKSIEQSRINAENRRKREEGAEAKKEPEQSQNSGTIELTDDMEVNEDDPAVQCPRCRHYSPFGTSFCGNCGFNLNGISICKSCGASLRPNAKFCGVCGSVNEKETKVNHDLYDPSNKL